LKMINAKTAYYGHEKRSRRFDLLVGCALPPNERLLQHIFRIRHAAEHSIRNRKQQTAIPRKYLQRRLISVILISHHPFGRKHYKSKTGQQDIS